MTSKPEALKIADAVLLPQAIPPLNPIIFIGLSSEDNEIRYLLQGASASPLQRAELQRLSIVWQS